MICTEDEAAAKWCPMARVDGNSITYLYEAVCLAGRCMMWVEIDSEAKTGYCGLAHRPVGQVG